MTNGAAARVGIGAIWVGAISATVSALTLVLVAVAIYRLPFPEANLLEAHGLKAVAGGMMGAFILAGLTFVAGPLLRLPLASGRSSPAQGTAGSLSQSRPSARPRNTLYLTLLMVLGILWVTVCYG